MFCGQCGKEISDASKFCTYCGASTGIEEKTAAQPEQSPPQADKATPALSPSVDTTDAASAPSPAPASIASAAASSVTESAAGIFKKCKAMNRKTAMYLGIAAIAIIAVFGIFLVAKSGGRNYIYSTLMKTEKAYNKELSDFVEKNTVLKAFKTNLSQSSTTRLNVPGVTMTLNNDKNSKALSTIVKGDSIPTIGLYLTDTRLIIGSRELMFIEADPKNLGGDLLALSKSISSLNDYKQLNETADILNCYDLSYSSLTSGKTVDKSQDYDIIKKRYTSVFKKLVDKANYKKEKTTIRIGEKDVNADMISLTADYKIIGGWLKNDLLTALRSDSELKKYWSSGGGVYGNVNSISDAADYDEYILDLADEFDDIQDEMANSNMKITAKAIVYKGVIVSLELITESDEFDKAPYVTISALGEKYRLNNINIEAGDEYGDISSVSIVGEHIGAPVLTSDITVRDHNSRERLSIEWDTKETSGNLRVKSAGETLKATFALDGKTVTARYDNISFRLEPLEEKVTMPEKTIILRNLTEDDINGVKPMLEDFL